MKKVLVVAPNEPEGAEILYKANNEISAIVNTLKPDLLSGDVTVSEFISRVKSGYDVIWFIAHMYKNEGIVLLDGYLTSEIIIQSLRHYNPELVVLNTCDNLDIAVNIHNELGCQVICTIADIEDNTSFSTGAALAENIKRYNTYYEAYRASSSGTGSQYRFIGRVAEGVSHVANDIEAKVQLLERIIGYDPYTGETSGLYKKVDDHDALLADQKEEIKNLGEKQDVANRTLFAILILLFFITIGLFFLINYMYTLGAMRGITF